MKREIHDHIAQLKREIDALPDAAVQTREHFHQMLGAIEESLEAKDQPTLRKLIGPIEETIERFEVEHPQATAVLNDIMLKLSAMGI